MKFYSLVEVKGSLLYLQAPPFGVSPLDKFSSHPDTLFLKLYISVILPSTPGLPSDLVHSASPTNMFYAFLSLLCVLRA
jgi:hypothetical protein